MGLAFGYAYAGSVAMLTTVLDDVRNVMMAGHLIVVVTFLWMQPRVLQSTMRGMESTERIKQVVNEAVPATEAALASDSSGDSTVMVGANDASDAEVLPTPVGMSEQADVGSAAVREMADASSSVNEQAAIGEDVSWSEPEVLAGDVAWDDDEIELLD